MTNSYRYVFAASTPTVPTSGTTNTLGIGEIGVYDGKSFQATSGVTAKSIIIAQGISPTLFPQGVAKGNFTPKTDVIKGANIKSWKRVIGKKGQSMITTLGFDGVDTTKNLSVPKNASGNFTFWVTLSGAPVDNILGNSPKTHYASWTEQFTVVLPCVDDCSDTCGDTYDCNVVSDAVFDAIKTRKIPTGALLTDYVKFTKLTSCDTPSGLPTVEYTTYTLTIPDNGSLASLGEVQAQYPDNIVTQVSRTGIFSTYQIIALTTDGAPDDFSSVGFPVVPSCGTCPSGCPEGYSLTTAQDVWIVSRPLSGATNLASSVARTAYAETLEAAYSATSSQFLSFNGATASVQLYFATGTDVTALLSDSVVQVGTNEAICEQDTPTTTSWVSCTTCTAAKKQYVLTVKNDDCGGLFTAAITAQYGQTPTVVTNSDTCTSKYTIVVESDNKDCDACDDVNWNFTAPAPFQGLVWTEVLGDTGYGTGCVCGIQAESIYEQRKAKECFLKQVAYEFEPLFISFSTRNPDPNDFSVLCATDVPVTVVRNVVYPRGVGRVVADQLIASNYAFNQPWRKNAAERDAFEYELGIDLQGIYDQYILEYDTKPDVNGGSHFGMTQTQTFEWSFFYPTGTGAAFESIISAFVASQAPTLVLEDIGTV